MTVRVQFWGPMRRLSALFLLLVAASPAEDRTCNIPVFRYALERWHSSPYDVVVFHKGPLTDEGKAALNALRGAGANIEVDRIDVSEPMPAKRQALFEKLKLDPPCIA